MRHSEFSAQAVACPSGEALELPCLPPSFSATLLVVLRVGFLVLRVEWLAVLRVGFLVLRVECLAVLRAGFLVLRDDGDVGVAATTGSGGR